MKSIRLALLVSLLITPATFAQAPAVHLARGGEALQQVVVARQATDRVRKAARTLAEYLGKITGATFTVTAGDGREGIAVGVAGDFPALPFPGDWKDPGPTERENYVLRSHGRGLHLLGATELAVEHAVWDLLHRVGYRQFFPGPHWEVIPHTPDLSVAVDAKEAPAYHARRIWYGYGLWGYNDGPYADWCAKNRATMGLELRTGHSYVGIIRGNQQAFDAHPEYYALVDGRRNTKPLAQLCISDPGLRDLVVRHALRHFADNPDADSISLDPNDGGGWCECAACARMGGVSDRVVTLANEVADAVNRRYPGKYVGIYAYASHSPPPSVRVHPHVVVSVATAFTRGGLTLDEIIAGWSAKGATLGVREYYSVHTWDRDLPGRSRGGNLAYLTRTIPEFHARGARFMSAESSDNWGPNGLGYYLAARLLWDVGEAGRADEVVDDFLTKAFGPAGGAMRRFYQEIDGSRQHLVWDTQIAGMYRALADAKKLADTPEVRARINDLLLFTRYADLFGKYRDAKGAERQAALERVIRHGYRMRRTMMIHSKALYRDVAARDKAVSIPENAQWGVAEAKNPWKSSEPYTEQELQGYLAAGLEEYRVTQEEIEPVEYSARLVPATPLGLRGAGTGTDLRGRGTQTFYTWVEQAPAKLRLGITGGLIAHYRDRGNVRVKLWRPGPADKLVQEDRSVPPDGEPHTVTLDAREPGLYKVTVSDGGDMTRVEWPAGVPLTVESSLGNPVEIVGRWSLHFYVPKGAKTVGLFGGQTGEVVAPDGKTAFSFQGRDFNFYNVPVPPGADGKLWQVRHTAGGLRLLTVPPYLARDGAGLLLPAEVVERDAARE